MKHEIKDEIFLVLAACILIGLLAYGCLSWWGHHRANRILGRNMLGVRVGQIHITTTVYTNLSVENASYKESED